MDRKCIFIHVIGIIALVLSSVKETETTEYYCTSEGNWKKTTTTCFDHGGTPVSYLDLTNGTEVKVKRGTTVWTADYFFLNYVKDVPQITADYDCGYTRFRESYNQSSRIYTYTPTDVNYDICTRKRPYICENSSDLFEGWLTDTWPEAYSSCNRTRKYKLWQGYMSVINRHRLNTSIGFWVNSARRLVRDTVSRPIPTDRHVIKCGTSEGIVKREGNNNCNEDLQAICRFENKITNTSFARSCLQDDNPTKTQIYVASTTPETSVQPREISTALSNSKTTTALAYLSKQSAKTVTEIFNSKKTSTTTAKLSSQSTFSEIFNSKKTSTVTEPSTQTKVISTELSNSKTKAASTKVSAQSTETFTEIFNSIKTSTVTVPSTQPTVVSTALYSSKTTAASVKLSTLSTDTFSEIFNSKKTSTVIQPSTQTKVISTDLSISKTRAESTKLSTQLIEITTEIFKTKKTSRLTEPSTQSTETFTEIFNDKRTSTLAMPSTISTVISTKLINSSGFQSVPNGLSKATITVVVTAAIAVIIGCFVTVILVLYFCRKRPEHKDTNSHRVQFKSPSAAREFLGNNDDATNIASHDYKAEVHDYHEAFVNVPDNILEPVNRTETKNGEYHYVCSVSENPKPPYKTLRRRSISDSEYDTTNNVKVVNESSNIYNKLGYETPECVYDSTISKPNRKPALDTNIYSKTSPGENLYDTTATGVGTSRLHDTALCPNDNIYSHTKAN